MRRFMILRVVVAEAYGRVVHVPDRSRSRISARYAGQYLFLVPAAVALSLATLPARAGHGTGVDSPPAKGYMDEKALKVLRDMSAYLTSRKTLCFGVTTLSDEVMESGILLKRFTRGEITLKRPDKFLAVVTRDDQEQRKVYFDGTLLVDLVVNKNAYKQIDFTGDTDSLLHHVIGNYDLELPLADFLFNDLAATFEEYLISAEHMGIRTVEAVPCHHLSFESTGADWQLWVEVGDKPVPRMFAITFVNSEHSPQLVAMFRHWQIDPQVDERLFSFRTPPGAEQVGITKVASPAGAS